jgi:hypothetical protein
VAAGRESIELVHITLAHSFSGQRRKSQAAVLSGLPDINYIKKHVSILEVARALSLPIAEKRGATWSVAHCFRPENHKNSDSTPSLNFQTKKNKFTCFVCDSERLRSNIDLVMEIEKISFRAAAEWIAQRWPVPRIEKKRVKDWDYRAGVTEFSRPEDLVKAGLLPHFKDSEVRLFIILRDLRDTNDCCSLSYAALMRLSGIGSSRTVSRAIRRFEQMGLLQPKRGWEKGTGRRSQNQYMFTFNDDQLHQLLTGVDKR